MIQVSSDSQDSDSEGESAFFCQLKKAHLKQNTQKTQGLGPSYVIF